MLCHAGQLRQRHQQHRLTFPAHVGWIAIQPLGPVEFGTYLRNEIRTWNTLVKDAGIKPE